MSILSTFFQIKKPIIEKRRRERINDSLNQLKSLVLDAMQKDVSYQLILLKSLQFLRKIKNFNIYDKIESSVKRHIVLNYS
jgi:hypothetical protein